LATFYPQPDPSKDFEAWARFVSTTSYLLSHLSGSILGLVFAIFGAFAFGAYLAKGGAGRPRLVAVVITVAQVLLSSKMPSLLSFSLCPLASTIGASTFYIL
jgi:hypothetical protein